MTTKKKDQAPEHEQAPEQASEHEPEPEPEQAPEHEQVATDDAGLPMDAPAR